MFRKMILKISADNKRNKKAVCESRTYNFNCMLRSLLSADFFFKINLFIKAFRNTIRVSNGLDSDKGFQKSSEDDICRRWKGTTKVLAHNKERLLKPSLFRKFQWPLVFVQGYKM